MSYEPLDFLRHILTEVEYLSTKGAGLGLFRPYAPSRR